ncbi:MAG TPA: molybdenum cofactor guanylyltransferase MobA [Eoetvoesiella sp.]
MNTENPGGKQDIAPALLTGLVLAGGQSARMQSAGQAPVDKGLAVWQGEPLIALAQRYLAPKVGRLCISANRNLDTYAQYGEVLTDDPSLGENAGPLAGIASVMAQAATPWLMVIPVDVPNLPDDLVGRLIEAVVATPGKIAYASTSARVHPLCMLVHKDLLGSLRKFLIAGERKVQYWQRANQALEVQFSDAEDKFFNINRPEDLLQG